MAFHDPDKPHVESPADVAERRAEAARLAAMALAADEANRIDLIAHEGRPVLPAGYVIASGGRGDGSPLPEGARLVAPVNGSRVGRVWASYIDAHGRVQQKIAVPAASLAAGVEEAFACYE